MPIGGGGLAENINKCVAFLKCYGTDEKIRRSIEFLSVHNLERSPGGPTTMNNRLALTAALCILLLPAGTQAATVYRFDGDRLSGAYQLKIDGKETPVTAFPDLDAVAYDRIAAANAKVAKWQKPAARFVGIHYAHLACSGPINVELTASEPIHHFTVHPKRRGVQATADGRVLRFQLDPREPRYLVIEVNRLPPFCLIVDPLEKDAPTPTDENVVDASNFLTDNSGKTDQTDAFRRAIAAVNGTGKTLYVPAGVYLTDTLKIHNAANFNIYLAPGCLIRIKTSPPGKNVHAVGISIDQSKNIRIFGRGYLDQQAYENFAVAGNDYRHRDATDTDPKRTFGDYQAVPALSQAAVLIMRSQYITLDGLTVRNGRNFNYNIIGCAGISLFRCKVLTPPASVPEWTDGIDVVATDSLALDGFFAYCNDDCFAWGNVPDYGPLVDLAQSRELTNCTVRGMVGWNTRANAIRLGWFGNASRVGVRDLVFENCDFCGMEASAILLGRLKEDPTAARQPRYGILKFIDCGFDCERILGRPFSSRAVRVGVLEFDNVVVDTSDKSWVIEGADRGAIGQLILRNVSVGGKKVSNLKEAGIHVKNVGKTTVEWATALSATPRLRVTLPSRQLPKVLDAADAGKESRGGAEPRRRPMAEVD